MPKHPGVQTSLNKNRGFRFPITRSSQRFHQGHYDNERLVQDRRLLSTPTGSLIASELPAGAAARLRLSSALTERHDPKGLIEVSEAAGPCGFSDVNSGLQRIANALC